MSWVFSTAGQNGGWSSLRQRAAHLAGSGRPGGRGVIIRAPRSPAQTALLDTPGGMTFSLDSDTRGPLGALLDAALTELDWSCRPPSSIGPRLSHAIAGRSAGALGDIWDILTN